MGGRSQVVLQRLGLGKLAPGHYRYRNQWQGLNLCFIAALLQAQGLRSAYSCSPHLLRYNERVQVAGVEGY